MSLLGEELSECASAEAAQAPTRTDTESGRNEGLAGRAAAPPCRETRGNITDPGGRAGQVSLFPKRIRKVEQHRVSRRLCSVTISPLLTKTGVSGHLSDLGKVS